MTSNKFIMVEKIQFSCIGKLHSFIFFNLLAAARDLNVLQKNN